jgi:hypothetical protein
MALCTLAAGWPGEEVRTVRNVYDLRRSQLLGRPKLAWLKAWHMACLE